MAKQDEQDQQDERQEQFPPQPPAAKQGRESAMAPRPRSDDAQYRGSGKLRGRAALVTGGDSGIGRAVAVFFAREGADVAIVYHTHDDDAKETCRLVEAEGRRCLALKGDVGDEAFCRDAVERAARELGRLDVLVNNAAEQHPQESIERISAEQLERTFRTNIFSMFHLTKAALPHLRKHPGASIVNTTSVTAYKGNEQLIDYSATKGAIVAFTRSLSQALAKEKIRVNAVAPGPIWTPLIASTFTDDEQIRSFGADVPLGRAGQPEEVAPSYVFLASDDASYITGQVLHPNGGSVVNA